MEKDREAKTIMASLQETVDVAVGDPKPVPESSAVRAERIIQDALARVKGLLPK